MKQFLPVALSFLIVACAPPKPGTDAHQRQLVEEARANFYAMKEQERRARGGAPMAREDGRNQEQQQEQQRPARVRLKPFAAAPARDTVFESSKPAPEPKVQPEATPAPKLATVPKRAPVKPFVVAKAPKPTPAPRKPAPAPKKFAWFAAEPKPTTQQKPAPKSAQKPVAKSKPMAKAEPAPTPKSKSNTRPQTKQDDTVYIFDMPKTKEPTSRRYRAYKDKYAASLGKNPENLNRKELEWVRTHYRE